MLCALEAVENMLSFLKLSGGHVLCVGGRGGRALYARGCGGCVLRPWNMLYVLNAVEDMLSFPELPGGYALCVGVVKDMLCVPEVMKAMYRVL
jgi:hypothetical protein